MKRHFLILTMLLSLTCRHWAAATRTEPCPNADFDCLMAMRMAGRETFLYMHCNQCHTILGRCSCHQFRGLSHL